MAESNVAAVLHAKDDLRVQEWPMPDLGANDVLIAIRNVGICGSDVHYWTHGEIGPFKLRAPMVIGHESAGEVVRCGDSVRGLKPGDRVAIEPGVPCRACARCKGGQYNLCPDMQFFATPPVHGSLAKYVTHAADFCYKLPSSVSLEEGAMCEPLSVGVHACRRAGVTAGSRVLVLGAGPIGLVSLMVAKAFGATHVCVTDVRDERLAVATELGADAVLNVSGLSPDEAASRACEAEGQFSCAIECCGFESATKTALAAVQPGGCVCIVGMAQPTMTLPVLDAACREVDIRGIFRYRDTYPTCIQLLAAGKVNVQPLITHRLSFTPEEVMRGFSIAKTGEGGAIKVMFAL